MKEDKAKAKDKKKVKDPEAQEKALARRKARESKKVITFDYEEVSGYSDMLKKALKGTYDEANSIVNQVLSLKPEDFVENVDLNKLNRLERLDDDLDDDDIDKYDEIYMELEEGLSKALRNTQQKNRDETNWKPAKPALRPLQDKYVKFMKKYNEDNKPADFQAAKRQKDLILKHYKASDVPDVRKSTAAARKKEPTDEDFYAAFQNN